MKTKIVCSACGSEDVQAQVWVKLNECFRPTTEFVDEMIREEAYCWCCQCGENRKLIIQESEKTTSSENDTIHCNKCGSTNVQTQSWVAPNKNNELIGDCEDYKSSWCDECGRNVLVIPHSELMEDIELWWKQLENGEDREVITGLQTEDYDPANDCQAFDVTCDEAWSAKTNDEKIFIWKTLTQRENESNK